MTDDMAVRREGLMREYVSLIGRGEEFRCSEAWDRFKESRLPTPGGRGSDLPAEFAAVGDVLEDVKPMGCELDMVSWNDRTKEWSVLILGKLAAGARSGRRIAHENLNVAAVTSAMYALGKRYEVEFKSIDCPVYKKPEGA